MSKNLAEHKKKGIYKPGQDDQKPKPKRVMKYHNKWYFADQEKICKQVWEIGQKYHLKLLNPETRPKNHVKFSVQLVKYFYFLYLSGARLSEPFLKPEMEMAPIVDGGRTIIQIKRVNEKHFTDGAAREVRDVIEAAIPIFDEWELKMWNFITDGGEQFEAERIFKFSEWGSLRYDRLSKMIKTNFKTNLRDEKGTMHRDVGINPHILRHMRAYNIMGEHGVKDYLTIQYFGWHDRNMLDYYAHIRRMLSLKNQITMIHEQNYGMENVKLGIAMNL